MKYLVLISLFLSFQISLALASPHWAKQVVGFSSQASPSIGSALQILGEPSAMPDFGFTRCAWIPDVRLKDEQWIVLKFDESIQSIKSFYISEPNVSNCIEKIILIDQNMNQTLIYKKKNIGIFERGAFSQLIFPVKYDSLFALKLILDKPRFNELLEIDAVGISDDTSSFEPQINLGFEQILSQPEKLDTNVNSIYHEVCPIISPDGKTLFFTRDGHPENIGKEKKQDIWYSNIDESGNFSKAVNLGRPVNNEVDNFISSITPDGMTILLGNVYNEDGSACKNGVSTSHFNGKSWNMPKELKISEFYNISNHAEYSLSNDGKTLVMCIETNDSRGSKDLYVSFKIDDTLWSKPMNLGDEINTAEDEIAPFLASDNKTLYFASSGYPGYGGEDIFVSKRLDSTWRHWSKPVNLGKPINSDEFDSYFSLPASGDYAYYVSSKNEYHTADIYRIKIPQSLRPNPVALIKGRTIDSKSNRPIGAKIRYERLSDGSELGNAESNPLTGEYMISLPSGVKYGFLAQADNYLSLNENIDLTDINSYEEVSRDLYLSPIELGQSIRLNNIFFNFDESELLPESFPELNRIIDLLSKSPNLKIVISGNTDNTGNENHNKQLSLRRAQAVANYLTRNSNVKSRALKVEGNGSRKPIDDNSTEQGRQNNRRVEFKIIGL